MEASSLIIRHRKTFQFRGLGTLYVIHFQWKIAKFIENKPNYEKSKLSQSQKRSTDGKCFILKDGCIYPLLRALQSSILFFRVFQLLWSFPYQICILFNSSFLYHFLLQEKLNHNVLVFASDQSFLKICTVFQCNYMLLYIDGWYKCRLLWTNRNIW